MAKGRLRCWGRWLVAVFVLVGLGAGGHAFGMFQNFGPFAYVANYNGGSVSVIDLGTESEIATFNTGGDPYWAAISANGSVVAVTLHDQTGVALFNSLTHTLLGIVGVSGANRRLSP